MDITKSDVLRLLEALSAKTGFTLDGKGFLQMESLFQDISYRYLKESLYETAKRRGAHETFNPRLHKLDEIARYLGYKHFLDFIGPVQSSALSAQQKSLIGAYWSIVRCNSGHPDLLISPVEITEQENKLFASLRSPLRTFSGPIEITGECICLLLRSSPEKQIHIVLKLGTAIRPKVLQGVFSGMNSAGIPIAGRELLIRQEHLSWDVNNTNRLPIAEALHLEGWKAVGHYFGHYSRNNLKVKQVARFDLGDLLLDD